MDPSEQQHCYRAYLGGDPNFLTGAQHHFIIKDVTTIGRWHDMPGAGLADFAIRTADKFISKNHCQINRRKMKRAKLSYLLGDVVPSKNGTFIIPKKYTTA